ncbi:MAG: MarR family EPS-associated transcriptional regulator [Paracoccaceae bacterium]
MTQSHSDDIRFRVLRILQERPDLSQRELAAELGASLGSVNYILRALTEKGQVKVRNFRASNNKLRYLYVLTPRGIAEKSRLTRGFLRRKIAEYEQLREEIEAIQSQIDEDEAFPGDETGAQMDSGQTGDTELGGHHDRLGPREHKADKYEL